MNEQSDPLDRALSKLPPDLETSRDLWPQIAAQLQAESPGVMRRPLIASGWMQLAAGLLLVVASSLTTYGVMRPTTPASTTAGVIPAMQDASVMPASFSPETMGPRYANARADLERTFKERIAALPPAARAKVESNLAEIRRAADEVARTLAQHPSDPLLQELLVSTYQSELQLFADVSAVTQSSSVTSSERAPS